MAQCLKGMAAAAALFLVPPSVSPVFAHHVMGGELPNTAWHGMLSGLGHPIIGLDHFAFIVGVGLMSQLAGRITVLPLVFVLGTVWGCFLHVQGVSLTWAEPAIALTVAAAAAIVATRPQIPIIVLATVLAGSGVFHGYAYGESIVGAETRSLTAYVIGFGVVQYCIAVGSGALLRMIVGRDYLSEATAMRIAGGGIALAAALAFVNVALID